MLHFVLNAEKMQKIKCTHCVFNQTYHKVKLGQVKGALYIYLQRQSNLKIK